MLTLIWVSSKFTTLLTLLQRQKPATLQPPDFAGSGFYSLPLASASNTDIGQLSCCSQSLAQAVTKLVVLKLWDLVPSA